jgi:adenylate kinase
MKNKIIAITGVTGVGKDYLVDKANGSLGFRKLNLGTLISEIVQTDRDQMMSTLDPSVIRAAQFAAYRQAVNMQSLLVTCHAIREQAHGYSYELAMERIFKPSLYVLVTAPPATIADRVHKRNLRSERRSRELSIQEIALLQAATIEAMQELTAILGCKLLIINNLHEAISTNTDVLRRHISQIM